ncbi:MAG: alcohol dehydrogenase class IV [Candidatus Promineifilaceae bacterium]
MTSQILLPPTLNVPPQTVSGAGRSGALADLLSAFGPRIMLVHGRSLKTNGHLDRILADFSGSTSTGVYCHAGTEPTLDEVTKCVAALRAFKPDCVVAVGGGSVMDLAKASAGLIDAPLSVDAYHGGEPLPASHCPFVAVPTTAGTGSEATYVSVLSDTELGIKKSIRDPSHLPRLVVLDPVLLRTCPAHVLAASGMDAFTQAVEAYVSRGATDFSDDLALRGAATVFRNLMCIAEDRDAPDAAYLELLQGSYMAGLALSHARLGLVHGLAHPLGYRFHAPHGLVCGVCLPAVIRFNREAASAKFDVLSSVLGGDILDLTEDALARLGLASPFAGKGIDDIDAVVAETLASGSTKANPRLPTEQDVVEMLAELCA